MGEINTLGVVGFQKSPEILIKDIATFSVRDFAILQEFDLLFSGLKIQVWKSGKSSGLKKKKDETKCENTFRVEFGKPLFRQISPSNDQVSSSEILIQNLVDTLLFLKGWKRTWHWRRFDLFPEKKRLKKDLTRFLVLGEILSTSIVWIWGVEEFAITISILW